MKEELQAMLCFFMGWWFTSYWNEWKDVSALWE